MRRVVVVAASVLATVLLVLGTGSAPGARDPVGGGPVARAGEAEEGAKVASRVEPLGDVSGLPLPLRRALTDPAGFGPCPEPRPGDWLAVHEEEGQTFEEFRVARRRPVTEERRTLGLLPLDDLASGGVPTARIVEYVAAFYGLPARAIDPGAMPEFESRVNAATQGKQVLTRDVLRWLQGQVPSDAYCVLALTTTDLYPEPGWNFVFGEASLVARVGVFSFARMAPEFPRPPPPAAERGAEERARVAARCLKVVTHEIGHMFGMKHCVHHACLMNGCNHVPEMDRTPLHLCPVCLRKVQHAVGFDAVARYRRLAEVYGREGLADARAWAEARAGHAAAEAVPTGR